MKIQFKRLFNSKSIVVIQFNSIFNFRHFETPFTPWLNMNLSCFFESLNQKESIMIKCTVENKLMCSIIRLDSLQINNSSKFMIFSSSKNYSFVSFWTKFNSNIYIYSHWFHFCYHCVQPCVSPNASSNFLPRRCIITVIALKRNVFDWFVICLLYTSPSPRD